MLIIDHNNYY